ncbi:hypothetical protein [Streptomyces flaveus]|uniref:hypothetical protein n=1 Tax=Streptomyces flaveus TaxID=66370 RepID=UPI003331D7C4
MAEQEAAEYVAQAWSRSFIDDIVLRDVNLVEEFQRSWLLAQLGPDTDPADLKRRFFRLRSARDRARGPGRAAREAPRRPVEGHRGRCGDHGPAGEPLGIERQIEQVGQVHAPDGPGDEDEPEKAMTVTWLTSARRYR